MVKVMALLPRRPDISRDEFHSHWISPHGELASTIEAVQAYVQCHRLRPGVPGLPEADYEGIAEVWFTDLEAAGSMGEDPIYTEQVHPDEANFIDQGRAAVVFTDESVVRAGTKIEKDTPVVKAQILLRRPADGSREDFVGAWAESDQDFSRSFRRALRLVRTEARAESYAEGPPPADGFAEIWWPDRESFEADWDADGSAYLSVLQGFADPASCSGFLSEEIRFVWT